MSRWRPLEDYTPFARTIVHYMWEQRPPLLPAQFADKAGVSRQLISRILNQDIQPDPLVVRAMARVMHVPTSQLLTIAGYTTDDDPLYASEEVWDVVLLAIATAHGLTDQERTALHTRLLQLRDGVSTRSADDGDDAPATREAMSAEQMLATADAETEIRA